MTGDAQVDLAGAIEYLWAWYRAIVQENEYVRNSDVGTTVTQFDAQLAAIAALTPTAAENLPYFTAVNAAALTSLTAFARSILDDANAAAVRATLGLGTLAVLNTVGTTELTDDAVTYAKLQNVSSTDRLLGRSTAGAGDAEEILCTAAGRSLIGDASASGQRTTLGLGTIAIKNVGITATITTAKLTPAGADGSMSFVDGILIAQTQAT